MDVQKLQDLISEKREQMVADMIEMSSIPAVNRRWEAPANMQECSGSCDGSISARSPMRYMRFRTKMSKKACAST